MSKETRRRRRKRKGDNIKSFLCGVQDIREENIKWLFYTHILLSHSSLPFLSPPFHLAMKYWNALSGKKVPIGGYPAVPTDKRATTNGRRFQISLLIF